MVLDVILAVLAALGIVLLGWCLVGSFLVPARGSGYCILIYQNGHDRRRVNACLFLQRSGLLRMPLVVIDQGMTEAELAEFRRLENGHDFYLLDGNFLHK